MFLKGFEVIQSEWKFTGFFIFLILILGCIPIFIYNAMLLNILLYAFGIDLYNGYFTIIGKKLRGEPIENPYKSIVFAKDKNGSDFFILIVFFGAILLIFKGPMILLNTLFAEKANEIISSSGPLLITFSLLAIIANSAYKISIYAAASSLKYFNNDVLDSFKTGIKGIWNFKLFVLIIFLYELVASFILESGNQNIAIFIRLSYFIIPSFLMIFMISKYNIENFKEEPMKIVADSD
jgi:hypothetical protein